MRKKMGLVIDHDFAQSGEAPPEHNDLRVRRVFAWLPVRGKFDEATYWLCRVWLLESYIDFELIPAAEPRTPYWCVINASRSWDEIADAMQARKAWLANAGDFLKRLKRRAQG